MEVAVTSQYLATPRLGHLEGLKNMFEYLRKHEMTRIVFDPSHPKVDESVFASGTTDWKDFYGDIEEKLPPGMPEPLGKKYAHNMFRLC
jgi:hypothetical protein